MGQETTKQCTMTVLWAITAMLRSTHTRSLVQQAHIDLTPTLAMRLNVYHVRLAHTLTLKAQPAAHPVAQVHGVIQAQHHATASVYTDTGVLHWDTVNVNKVSKLILNLMMN